MSTEPATYPGYRFPAEAIHYTVWLYHVFSLSLRDIELILAERGVVVSYESIRRWCLRFGTEFAARLRKRRPRPGDTWHMDEVLTLSAKSGGRRQSCETGDACLGRWQAIEPTYYP
ncbi:Transposase (plasmid) [Roseomonas mucosa]|uniref:Transposase n=1 Tax=Roseomonas mucosa TaxID=207340 RepID=A0A379PJJ7_9PROT|nr:IS6 family transposase [Roseomonas mucosa]MBS5905536.1 IS6 family transposase [Acetobacteraceae bacterium]MCG7354816.1 IS6 family transposase [Roseomonas mucosa]MCG7359579.1 IS6 family transposase [Roseomonas mucosa]MDT8292337.1 IS6 family transposase [Roseomonas mucosa]MDT8296642.1 IS6 family transposase [Roseomonas mucosa]